MPRETDNNNDISESHQDPMPTVIPTPHVPGAACTPSSIIPHDSPMRPWGLMSLYSEVAVRHREVKQLAKAHTGVRNRTRAGKPGILVSEFMLVKCSLG